MKPDAPILLAAVHAGDRVEFVPWTWGHSPSDVPGTPSEALATFVRALLESDD